MNRRRNFMTCTAILLFLAASCTSDAVGGAVAAIDNVGPLSGTGISPALGHPASDLGAAVATSTSMDAVSFHGGAWVVPLAPQTPGTSIASVVTQVTGNTMTPTQIQLISSTSGTIGVVSTAAAGTNSYTIQPSSSHVTAPGEEYTLVYSPQLSNGGWASLDTTIGGAQFGCSVTHTRKMMPFAGQNFGGIFQTQAVNFAGIWQPVTDGNMLAVSIPVEVGEQLKSLTAMTFGTLGWSLHVELDALDDPDQAPVVLGSADVTTAGDQVTVIPVAENVTASNRAYSASFTGHLLSSGFHPRVGPITITTIEPCGL